ncbi:MAG: hypothetical protein CMQ05_14935 [Gammaproteobacteria bacterium]|uniref:Uncharacterized protein n=1 Tax=OM182 bacterium MED-G24 TaxID=1986255 RepID=A0A2A5WTU7_9GAMM|nr:hypothetical protein [Gammaproteobacteria bacterium]PDH39657.1 MAG: hypothetical protein CNE99_05235 [OM182 bacterium MED-G24]
MRRAGSIYRSGNWITIGLLTVLVVSFGIFSQAVAGNDNLQIVPQQMMTAQTPTADIRMVNRSS